MIVRSILVAVAAAHLALAGSCLAEERPREPTVGLPCERCELHFEGMPKSLDSTARIAPASEPGASLRIDGTVTDRAGKPAPGIIVYAYHTDASGIYPRLETPPGSPRIPHGRLRGWAKTDAGGTYRFDTIRPAGYPDTNIPQHVHMHVIEPGRCAYYIDDVLFTDDPRLTAAARARLEHRGGDGVATPSGNPESGWVVRRDIRLGANIPGYSGCESPRP